MNIAFILSFVLTFALHSYVSLVNKFRSSILMKRYSSPRGLCAPERIMTRYVLFLFVEIYRPMSDVKVSRGSSLRRFQFSIITKFMWGTKQNIFLMRLGLHLWKVMKKCKNVRISINICSQSFFTYDDKFRRECI